MTVRCPGCRVTYRVSPQARPDDGQTFRCSRCERVFALDDEANASPDDTDLERDAADGADPDAAPPATGEDAEGVAGRPLSAGRFALRTLAGVTLVFTLLSIYVFTHRARVADLLGRLPVVGPDLAATRLAPGHVQLADVRGAYTRVAGDTLVFVVTGSAVNNAPVPVSAIEIEARVVGAREQRQRAYAGAAPHDVHGLSKREIDLLQSLQPPDDWRLSPGDDGAFLLAFVDPPVPLTEFSVEVASVLRRRARHAD